MQIKNCAANRTLGALSCGKVAPRIFGQTANLLELICVALGRPSGWAPHRIEDRVW